MQVVREGITKELVITDFDFLFPHNICRHILPAEKVMTSKVKSIKDLYKGIFAQKLTALEGNYLSLCKHDKERMNDGTQLIIVDIPADSRPPIPVILGHLC